MFAKSKLSFNLNKIIINVRLQKENPKISQGIKFSGPSNGKIQKHSLVYLKCLTFR